MPMTYEEKLREEFNKWHAAETTFALGVPSDASIADWWLQHHIEFVEGLRKVAENYKCGDHKKLMALLSPPSLTVTNK